MAVSTGPGTLPGLNTKGLTGINPQVNPQSGQPAGKPDGIEFKRALEQATGAVRPQAAPQASATGELKFSNHAIERMRSRGINFQPDEMKNIASAVAKASAKGAKDTLILAGENALIVSVKNNTVVTVMDRQAMKDNVFTNIDSTVVI